MAFRLFLFNAAQFKSGELDMKILNSSAKKDRKIYTIKRCAHCRHDNIHEDNRTRPHLTKDYVDCTYCNQRFKVYGVK